MSGERHHGLSSCGCLKFLSRDTTCKELGQRAGLADQIGSGYSLCYGSSVFWGTVGLDTAGECETVKRQCILCTAHHTNYEQLNMTSAGKLAIQSEYRPPTAPNNP